MVEQPAQPVDDGEPEAEAAMGIAASEILAPGGRFQDRSGTTVPAASSERFADVAPATIFVTLLDAGRYCGSIRTMYRLGAAQNQTGERRRQRIHPLYTKPELLAIRPNEVWSWDITKLKGPAKWTCFRLYVILDIFSRKYLGAGFRAPLLILSLTAAFSYFTR